MARTDAVAVILLKQQNHIPAVLCFLRKQFHLRQAPEATMSKESVAVLTHSKSEFPKSQFQTALKSKINFSYLYNLIKSYIIPVKNN